MIEGLYSAAAGMEAQQQRMDAIGNDLANVDTTGYQSQRVGFEDLLYGAPTGGAAQGVAVGSGSALLSSGPAPPPGRSSRPGARSTSRSPATATSRSARRTGRPP